MPADTIALTAAEPHPADSLTDEQLEAIAREADAAVATSKKVIVNQDDLENILREVELTRAVVQTACTCCSGPQSAWFTTGSCAQHPVISDDQVDALIDDPEADPPLSAYAAVAESLGLPALWPMFIPGTTRDMFEEDAAKLKRLVKMVGDYLDCPDTERGHIECMAAGLAEINRNRAPDLTGGNRQFYRTL
jgi:hypothetical protein